MHQQLHGLQHDSPCRVFSPEWGELSNTTTGAAAVPKHNLHAVSSGTFLGLLAACSLHLPHSAGKAFLMRHFSSHRSIM